MRLSLIYAVAENGVIGHENRLPWHLPADLRHFKRVTMGHPIIMGRLTFESIGRPLPGRRNVVLSRTPGYAPPGVEVQPGLGAALAALANHEEVFVIGGAAAFREALPLASTIHVTRVHAEVAGDVRLPELDPDVWKRVESESHPADADHPLPYSFERWERRESEGGESTRGGASAGVTTPGASGT